MGHIIAGIIQAEYIARGNNGTDMRGSNEADIGTGISPIDYLFSFQYYDCQWRNYE